MRVFRVIILFVTTVLFVMTVGEHTHAGSLSGALSETENGFKKSVDRNKQIRKKNVREAKERARNRDKSNDVCYQLPAGSDAQTACLGKYPMAVSNERARNLLLGNCFAMGSGSELSSDLSYVCSKGKKACSVLDNGDAAYWCEKCGATRRWLAVYSLGHTIQCFD